MEVKIKYLRDIEPIGFSDNGDWVDLRCGKDIFLLKDEFTLIPLGIAMELPKGYEALVIPRSSTFNKYGLIQTNSVGLIDESYHGDNDEWKLPVIATRNIEIKKNERICQFRIEKKMEHFDFRIVEELNNDDRGGFGSTGRI